jgi:hypothetical protein
MLHLADRGGAWLSTLRSRHRLRGGRYPTYNRTALSGQAQTPIFHRAPTCSLCAADAQSLRPETRWGFHTIASHESTNGTQGAISARGASLPPFAGLNYLTYPTDIFSASYRQVSVNHGYKARLESEDNFDSSPPLF